MIHFCAGPKSPSSSNTSPVKDKSPSIEITSSSKNLSNSKSSSVTKLEDGIEVLELDDSQPTHHKRMTDGKMKGKQTKL